LNGASIFTLVQQHTDHEFTPGSVDPDAAVSSLDKTIRNQPLGQGWFQRRVGTAIQPLERGPFVLVQVAPGHGQCFVSALDDEGKTVR
ncbi:hypothetical protein, partial [Devosia sp.]|uniref:hypothetical protein n=1 Tax=Devosia sp. TaxID=1871048 RepID=UPI0027354077